MIDLCIIIVHFNTPELLNKCLLSLKEIDVENYKVVIVDNNSYDTDLQVFKKLFPTYHFILLERNYGFSYANNYAIRLFNARNYLLLNPDTELIDKRLSKVLLRLEMNDVGILGCNLLNPDYTNQPSTCSFPNNFSLFINFSGIKYFKNTWFFKQIRPLFYLIDKSRFERQSPIFNKEKFVDVVWGAFFLVKKDVFDKIGLLDEEFFLGGEENEFCYRAKLNNIKTLYFPGYSIIHHFNASVKKNRILSLNAQLEGFIHYYKKHFSKKRLRNMITVLKFAFRIRIVLIKLNLLEKYLAKNEGLEYFQVIKKILKDH